MYKSIIAALAGLALCVPGQARVEEGTVPLLDLLDESGILISYNTSDCDSDEYLGLYRHAGMRRQMVLCPGSSVDADDHMVVRHETIHAIQHCVNVARGTHLLTPVIDDDEQLMEWVYEHLDRRLLRTSSASIPLSNGALSSKHSLMHAYTSEELAEIFRSACTFTEVDHCSA